MARNDKISVPAGAPTRLSDASGVLALTFQVHGPNPVLVSATTDTSPPAATAARLSYPAGFGEADTTLEKMFPGLSGALHLWGEVVGDSSGTEVSISHSSS